MITSTTPPAADPESSLRPRRYGIAIAVAALVVLALIASSILNYVYLDTIPGRASLYGLLTVALITLGTYILVRAYDRDRTHERPRAIVRNALIETQDLLATAIVVSIRRARDLADAIEARGGLGAGANLPPARTRVTDGLVLLASTALCVVSLAVVHL